MPRRTDRRHIYVRRYKTQMCRVMEATGACEYGHDCLFAHSPDELRTEEKNVAECVTPDVIAAWIAAKKRTEGSDVVLPQSQRSDSESVGTNLSEYVFDDLREKPTRLDARRALGRLWRGANRHLSRPPKVHSRRRGRHRAVLQPPRNDPYALVGQTVDIAADWSSYN